LFLSKTGCNRGQHCCQKEQLNTMRYALQAKKRSAFARGSKKKRGPAVMQPNPKKNTKLEGAN